MIRSLRHRIGLILVLALLGLVALGGASNALAQGPNQGGRSSGPTANPVAGLRPAVVSAAPPTPTLFPVTEKGFTTGWGARHRRHLV